MGAVQENSTPSSCKYNDYNAGLESPKRDSGSGKHGQSGNSDSLSDEKRESHTPEREWVLVSMPAQPADNRGQIRWCSDTNCEEMALWNSDMCGGCLHEKRRQRCKVCNFVKRNDSENVKECPFCRKLGLPRGVPVV